MKPITLNQLRTQGAVNKGKSAESVIKNHVKNQWKKENPQHKFSQIIINKQQ